MNIQTATPAEIDTVLAEALNIMHTAEAKVEMNLEQIAKVEEQIAEGGYYGLVHEQNDTIAKINADIAALDEVISAQAEIIDPLQLEFRARGGWTRAYIVTNSNGHIHNKLNCTTCFATTQYGWLTQVSGQDENEIVAQAGMQACTVCYSSAPSEYFLNKSTLELPEVKAAREERAAAKAAREAEKAAKGISNPDGTPLKGEYGIIKTERTAQIDLVTMIADNKAFGYSLNSDLADRITAALAHKRNQTVEEVMTVINAKVAAKVKAYNR